VVVVGYQRLDYIYPGVLFFSPIMVSVHAGALFSSERGLELLAASGRPGL